MEKSDVDGVVIPTVIVNPRPGYNLCPICKKEFTQGTLLRNGGTCFRCSKKKCACKTCEVENVIEGMWDREDGPFCMACYSPRVLSYLIYPVLFFSLGFFIDFIFIILFLISVGFGAFVVDNPNELLKNFHYSTFGPSKVHRSVIFIIVITAILAIIVIWAMVSPWAIYTVQYDHSLNGVDYRYTDYGGVAFTHEYHLEHVTVRMDKSNEDKWIDKYFEFTLGEDSYEQGNADNYAVYGNNTRHPWFYSNQHNNFTIQYEGSGYFEERKSVAFTTQILGFTSFLAYLVSAVIAGIFFRMTSQLEPKYLYLKNREIYQTKLATLAKKIEHMKNKGMVLTSLSPMFNEFKVSKERFEETDERNPLTILKILILTMCIGFIFSIWSYSHFWGNWFEAGLDDGLSLEYWSPVGWWGSLYPYIFTGNYGVSPTAYLLITSSFVAIIMIISHAIFLHRSCYNMVNENIKKTKKIKDFKIPSEFTIDTKEAVPTAEEKIPLEEDIEIGQESVENET